MSTIISPVTRQAPAPRNFLRAILTWVAVAHERRQLRRMDAHTLNDLGLLESDAMKEADRPFWDAPARWRS